jgi:hypothetical protein
VKDFGSVTFAAVGDWGDDYSPESQQSCASLDNAEPAVAALIDSWQPQFVVGVGDINYTTPSGSCILKYDTTVGQYYHRYIGNYAGTYGAGAPLNRFFMSKGNHEWHADTQTTVDYADFFNLPGIPIPGGFRDNIANPSHERYYRFTWGPIEFFALSSDTDEPDGTSSTSTQGVWLQNALAASTALWKVVFFHHQPYSSGGDGTELTGNLRMRWPFKEWGADVVLSGHRHNYERIVVDDFPYFVVGTGGTSLEGYGTKVSGSQAQYRDEFGALRVQVTATTMTLELYSTTISVPRTVTLRDTHVITKTALVPKHATWKYLDNGSNQGTAWRAVAFNDASWASGPAPLGYGDSDEVTTVDCGPGAAGVCSPGNGQSNNYITTYFRKSFTVSDPSRFSSLTLRLHRDDGAVVYLNGTELVRSNMPAGTITHTTLASSAVEGAWLADITGLSNSLQTGTNVLAVEIHQASAGSSDVSFDLELIGVDTAAPKVNKVIIGSSTANATSHPDCDFGSTTVTACQDGSGEQIRTVPVAAAARAMTWPTRSPVRPKFQRFRTTAPPTPRRGGSIPTERMLRFPTFAISWCCIFWTRFATWAATGSTGNGTTQRR